MLCKCKDCTERYIGCHAKCKSYLEYRNCIETKNKLIRENKKKESILCRHNRMQIT